MASAISHLTISAIADSMGVKLQDPSLLNVIEQGTEVFLKSFLKDADAIYQSTRSYKLTMEHLEMVLEGRNMQPLYGYECVPNYAAQPVLVDSADLFVARESLCNLEEIVASGATAKCSCSIHKFNWTLVEGVEVGKKGAGNAARDRRRERDSKSRSMERSGSVPNVASFQHELNPVEASEHSETHKVIDDFVSPELQKFFVNSVNLLRFDTVNSFEATLDKLVEEDRLQPLIPSFLQWAFGKFTLRLREANEVFAVLELLRALAANRFVNCSLYVHAFLKVAFTGLLSVQLSPDGNDRFVRDSAAELLRVVCCRCEGDFVTLKESAFNALVNCLFNPSFSVAAHYGALAGIRALGRPFVARLMPHVPGYVRCIGREMRKQENPKCEQLEAVLQMLRELAEGNTRVVTIIDKVYYA